MQAYSNPERATDKWSLPDVEVFYHDKADGGDAFLDGDGEPMPSGFYFWFCFPGCMPDSDPFGPYDTEDEALTAAQEMED